MTLTELLVVVFVLAFVVFMFWPAFFHPGHMQRLECVNNLKETYLAARIWSGDNGEKYPMQVSVTNGGAMELVVKGDVAGCFRTMSNELSAPKILVCPEDKKHVAATNFAAGLTHANISYFLSLDAGLDRPQSIFSGDDNLLVNRKPVPPGILSFPTSATVAWTKERTSQSHAPGNIVLADGSALQTTTPGLRRALQQSSFVTNRWVIP